MGISYDSVTNRAKRGMPSAHMLEKIIINLFRDARTWQSTTYQDEIEEMFTMTGFKYEFEYEIEFGITRKQILAESRKMNGESLLEKKGVQNTIYEPWPDMTPIKNAIIERPVDLQKIAEEIAAKFIKNPNSETPQIIKNRLIEYINMSARMPKPIHAFMLEYLNKNSQLTELNLIDGYAEIRKKIITLLLNYEFETANSIFKKFKEDNMLLIEGGQKRDYHMLYDSRVRAHNENSTKAKSCIENFDRIMQFIYDRKKKTLSDMIKLIAKQAEYYNYPKNIKTDEIQAYIDDMIKDTGLTRKQIIKYETCKKRKVSENRICTTEKQGYLNDAKPIIEHYIESVIMLATEYVTKNSEITFKYA